MAVNTVNTSAGKLLRDGVKRTDRFPRTRSIELNDGTKKSVIQGSFWHSTIAGITVSTGDFGYTTACICPRSALSAQDCDCYKQTAHIPDLFKNSDYRSARRAGIIKSKQVLMLPLINPRHLHTRHSAKPTVTRAEHGPVIIDQSVNRLELPFDQPG